MIPAEVLRRARAKANRHGAVTIATHHDGDRFHVEPVYPSPCCRLHGARMTVDGDRARARCCPETATFQTDTRWTFDRPYREVESAHLTPAGDQTR